MTLGEDGEYVGVIPGQDAQPSFIFTSNSRRQDIIHVRQRAAEPSIA